ncbi:hypothetical protein AGMMS49940_06160 [Spirochaetia bacterium]|nr:hypothetical protein AGMMS49940_06160 [Spirochaetia bacterium]
MKTTKSKVFLFGMVIVVMAVGLAFVGCKKVFEGDEPGYLSGEEVTKKLTVTLSKKKWEVKWGDKSADGSINKYEKEGNDKGYWWTDNGTGSAIVNKNKTLDYFSHTSKDGTWWVTSYGGNLKKKSVEGDENVISLDDVELIILDDEDEE